LTVRSTFRAAIAQTGTIAVVSVAQVAGLR
jgi:hypothetical protein